MSHVRSVARAATLCLAVFAAGAPAAAADAPDGPRWTLDELPAADGAPAITIAVDATTGERHAVKYDGGALGTIWLDDCDDPVRNPGATATGALAGDQPACRFARSAGDGNAEGDGDWLAPATVAAAFGASVSAEAVREAWRSPDGARMLVWLDGGEADTVWTARFDGTQPRLLAVGANIVIRHTRWTAAGAAQFTYQVGWGALRTATSTEAAGAGADTWMTVDPALAADPADSSSRFDVLHGVTLDGVASVADVAVERATGARSVIRTWTAAKVGGALSTAWRSECGDPQRNPSGTAYDAVRGATPACTFARTEPAPQPTTPQTPQEPQTPQTEVKPPVSNPPAANPGRVKLLAVGTKLGGKGKNLLTVKYTPIDGKGLRVQLVIRGKGGKSDVLLARAMLTAEQAKTGSTRLKLSRRSVKKLRAVKGKGLAVQLSALTADGRPLS